MQDGHGAWSGLFVTGILISKSKDFLYLYVLCTSSEALSSPFLKIFPCPSDPSYKKATAKLAKVLTPKTAQPVCFTFSFVIILAVSQVKCLNPLKL